MGRKIQILLFALILAAAHADTLLRDEAKVMNSSQRRTIEDVLLNLNEKTTVEFAVVTVKTLGNETIEEKALRLFNELGIGKKGKDNGILLLIAVKERKYRTEVGYGLEAIINDAYAGRLARDDLVPYFRKGQYYEGILLFVNDIHNKLTDQYYSGADNIEKLRKEIASKPLPQIIAGLVLLIGFLNTILASAGFLIRFGANFTLIFVFMLLINTRPLLAACVAFFLSLFLSPDNKIKTPNKFYYSKYNSGFGGSNGSFGGFGGGGGFGGFGGGRSGGGGASGSW